MARMARMKRMKHTKRMTCLTAAGLLALGLVMPLAVTACGDDSAGADAGARDASVYRDAAGNGDAAPRNDAAVTDAGPDGAIDAGGDVDASTGQETFTVVGTTDTVGFMSLFEYGNKLYAGTYGASTKVYSYPPWTEEAALNAGESVFAFGELNGYLFAITEDRGMLFRSADGSDFGSGPVFTSPDNNLGLGLFTIGGSIFATFTCFRPNTALPCVQVGKGPTLYRSSNGTDFTPVDWPPLHDNSCVVYENAPQLNGRVYKNSYCQGYSVTNIYSSANGLDWRLEQTYQGLKSYMVVHGGSIYGLRDGRIIIEYDGSTETDVATGPVDFHGMAFYRDRLYLSTSCWEDCAANPRANLYRYDLTTGAFTKITDFDEQGISKLYVFDDALFIATKSDRDDPSTHGKVYRMTF